MRAVPPTWLEEVAEARLSNSLEHYRPYAFFSRYDGCLTIYSRRGTTKQTVIAVLAALAAAPLGIKLRFGRYPSESDRRRILHVTQRMADEIMTKLTPEVKRGWWGHPVRISQDRTSRN